jgi:hypothetical protein
VTEHGFILETWTEADTMPVVDMHADLDALAARRAGITLEVESAGLCVRWRRQSQGLSPRAGGDFVIDRVEEARMARSITLSHVQLRRRRAPIASSAPVPHPSPPDVGRRRVCKAIGTSLCQAGLRRQDSEDRTVPLSKTGLDLQPP